jgi:hypothetical protein
MAEDVPLGHTAAPSPAGGGHDAAARERRAPRRRTLPTGPVLTG